jgi:hypothetical protein
MSGRESNAPIVGSWQPGDKTSHGRQVVLMVVWSSSSSSPPLLLLQVEQEIRPKPRISQEDRIRTARLSAISVLCDVGLVDFKVSSAMDGVLR